MLDETAQRDILAGIARLGPGGPIMLAVASDGYAQLLDNWLCHMAALDLRRILVVAMDARLAERLRGVDIAVARADFDGSESDFWLQRARIWEFLAGQGVEFIHSDIDAVWLRDPLPAYAATSFDLAISSGTAHPGEVRALWGFVVCTGLFWARPTVATRRLFHMLVTPPEAMLRSDDQALLNRLLAGVGTFWMQDGIETYELALHGHAFTCYRQPLSGFCAALGLRLTLLPHHLFPRLQPGAPCAMVRHVLRDGPPEIRIDRMRDAGCWRLDAHPGGFAIRA